MQENENDNYRSDAHGSQGANPKRKKSRKPGQDESAFQQHSQGQNEQKGAIHSIEEDVHGEALST